MRRAARLSAVILTCVAGTAMAATFWIPRPEVCAEGLVFYEDGCVFRDQLTVLLDDDQTRAELEAAIAPYGGVIDIALDMAGIYGVRFPPGSPEALSAIRDELVRAGFRASLDYPGELFASGWRQSARRST